MAASTLNGAGGQSIRISQDSLSRIQTIIANLKQDRQVRFEPTWKDISTYCNISMHDWEDPAPRDSGKGMPDMTEIYNATAPKAVGMLKDGVMGYAMSQSTPWFRLAYEARKLMDARGPRLFMEQAERHLYSQFARSNIYTEAGAFIQSGAAFGTGIMFRYEDIIRGVPMYKTLHLKRALITEDEYCQVDGLIRDFHVTAFEAKTIFKGIRLPDPMEEAIENGDTKSYFLVHHIIFPKGKYDIDQQVTTKPYLSLYVADCGWESPIIGGGYDVRPFFAWRWQRSLDGDVYSIESPGILELPNIKQANAVSKEVMRLAQLAGRPPIKATEGLQGRIKLTPNGITPLRQGEDFMPVQVTGDINAMLLTLQGLEQNIRESFHTDFFLLLTQNLDRMKTATEVQGLQGEKSAMMGAFFGRLVQDFLEPLIEDAFALEYNAGRIGDVPDEIRGQNVKIDMISPLAIMQRQYLTMGGADQIMGAAFQLAQAKPDIMDLIDVDAYFRLKAEAASLDGRILKDPALVAKERKARAEAQAAMLQQQQALQAGQVQADMMQKLGKAPEAGSPAAAAMEQQGGMV